MRPCSRRGVGSAGKESVAGANAKVGSEGWGVGVGGVGRPTAGFGTGPPIRQTTPWLRTACMPLRVGTICCVVVAGTRWWPADGQRCATTPSLPQAQPRPTSDP